MPRTARNVIEVLIKSKADKKGFTQTERALDTLGVQSTTTTKQLGGLSVGLGGAAAALGVAATAGLAFKKAMDFGRQGADIEQTAESFDLLLAKLEAAPGLLDKLQRASRGTVSDLKLMTSTSTLLAGVQGDLGRQMADSTPRLLEIAKAANKLNPALGSTTFLYESLARGIKRSAPLILDNLGLTIKLGDANQRLADRLGKSVKALSAEEKQMALLEDTLRAGEVLIDQVGGNIDSASDDFARMDTAIANASNTLKTAFAPAMTAVAEAVADNVPKLMTTIEQLGLLAEASIQAAEAAIKGEDAQASFNATVAEGIGEEEHAARIRREAAQERIKSIYAEIDALNRREDVLDWGRQAGLEALDVELKLAQAEVAMATNTDEATWAMERWVDMSGAVVRAAEGQEDATEDLTEDTKALEKAVNLVKKAYEGFHSTLASGIVDFRDMREEQSEAAEEYEDALSKLQAKAAGVYSSVKLDFEESLPDSTTLSERMGMAEDAWDEWGLRIQDIINQGVASPWFQVLQEMGYEKPPDVGIKEWAEDLKNQFYEGDLQGLINQDSQAWREHSATMQQTQAEATAAYNQEVATRKAAIQEEIDALKAAREEQLAAEAEARNRGTIELALTLAEQSGMLQQWSEQRFGPDFSQVADTAAEVMGLLDAGMLDIDDTLEGVIANNVAGIQSALDTTGALAEETKGLLDELATTDWAAEKQEQLSKALDLSAALPPEDVEALMGEVTGAIDSALPEDPFGDITGGFEGATTSMIELGSTLATELTSDFDDIGESGTNWANAITDAYVGHSTFPDMMRGSKNARAALTADFKAGGQAGENAAEQIASAWKRGMNDAKDAVKSLNNVIKTIPKEIVITIKTQVVGGGTGYQHGGQFTVEGPAGVDNVPVHFMATRGETVTISPARSAPPGMFERPTPRFAGSSSVSVGGDTYHIVVKDRATAAMLVAEVENRKARRFNRSMGV